MRSATIENPMRRRLRFVFKDTVRSSEVGIDATLQDIAQALVDLPLARYGRPVAIDLSFPIFDLSGDVRPMPISRVRKLRHNTGRTTSQY